MSACTTLITDWCRHEDEGLPNVPPGRASEQLLTVQTRLRNEGAAFTRAYPVNTQAPKRAP
jgi:hypothetical protein